VDWAFIIPWSIGLLLLLTLGLVIDHYASRNDRHEDDSE
jgi:hypothetical protein